VRFRVVYGPGLLTASSALTDAAGVAESQYVAGTTAAEVRLRASLAVGPLIETADALVTLVGTEPDLYLSVLDITFHDPTPARSCTPATSTRGRGRGARGARAGAQPRRHRLARRGGGALLRLGGGLRRVERERPGPRRGGRSGAARGAARGHGHGQHPCRLRRPGLPRHDRGGRSLARAERRRPEHREGNNAASQGFWIELPPLGGEHVITTTCALEAPDGFAVGDIPASRPGGALVVSGRADYTPFLPFDPDHTRGVAAVKGGAVLLSMTDAAGAPVTLVDPSGTTLMPAAGDEGQFRALHTIGTSPTADKTIIGRYPNRAPDDAWSFPVPASAGRYTLRTCVTDTSFTGCCERPFFVVPYGPNLGCGTPTLPVAARSRPRRWWAWACPCAAPSATPATPWPATCGSCSWSTASPTARRWCCRARPGRRAAGLVRVVPACATESVAVQVDPEGLIAEQLEDADVCTRSARISASPR